MAKMHYATQGVLTTACGKVKRHVDHTNDVWYVDCDACRRTNIFHVDYDEEANLAG